MHHVSGEACGWGAGAARAAAGSWGGGGAHIAGNTAILVHGGGSGARLRAATCTLAAAQWYEWKTVGQRRRHGATGQSEQGRAGRGERMRPAAPGTGAQVSGACEESRASLACAQPLTNAQPPAIARLGPSTHALRDLARNRSLIPRLAWRPKRQNPKLEQPCGSSPHCGHGKARRRNACTGVCAQASTAPAAWRHQLPLFVARLATLPSPRLRRTASPTAAVVTC